MPNQYTSSNMINFIIIIIIIIIHQVVPKEEQDPQQASNKMSTNIVPIGLPCDEWWKKCAIAASYRRAASSTMSPPCPSYLCNPPSSQQLYYSTILPIKKHWKIDKKN